VRSLIRGDFDAAFDANGAHKLDALLTATTPTTAFPVGDVYGDSVLMQYADQLTVPANHAGVPAISLPAGLSAERLPIGVQLIGPDFAEAGLLRAARAYEAVTESEAWRRERPQALAGAVSP
jgi:aspartyl-tRNA(Asn)/glutamyl-tRNA(Gln) amidotransferase subunit A